MVGNGKVGKGKVGNGKVGNGKVGNGKVGNGKVGNGKVGDGKVLLTCKVEDGKVRVDTASRPCMGGHGRLIPPIKFYDQRQYCRPVIARSVWYPTAPCRCYGLVITAQASPVAGGPQNRMFEHVWYPWITWRVLIGRRIG